MARAIINLERELGPGWFIVVRHGKLGGPKRGLLGSLSKKQEFVTFEFKYPEQKFRMFLTGSKSGSSFRIKNIFPPAAIGFVGGATAVRAFINLAPFAVEYLKSKGVREIDGYTHKGAANLLSKRLGFNKPKKSVWFESGDRKALWYMRKRL